MRPCLGVASIALGSSAALAGLVMEAPVEVTLKADGSGFASGSLATARYSDNDVEFIGCGVRRFVDAGGIVTATAFCQAVTADSIGGSCTTSNPGLLASIAEMNDFSVITFSWNAAGECRAIGSSTRSFHLPER